MSHPTEPFETQNVHDDDGPVIDSLFIETDAPPDLKELNEPIIVRALRDPAPITRIFSGEMTLDSTWAAQKILNADNKRKKLLVRVYSPTSTATDGVRIADDLGMLSVSGKLLHGGQVDFDAHTGNVYVVAVGNAANGTASASVSVQWWAVSESE